MDIRSEDAFYGSKESEFPKVTYPQECSHFAGCVYICPTKVITLRIPLPMMLVYKFSEEVKIPIAAHPTSSLNKTSFRTK